MKIALLSGALKNAGDFLITDRAISLLQHCIPNADITVFSRKNLLDNEIDTINSNDVLVFAGGPGYIARIYPDAMPFISDLDFIKIPMRSLGMGCYESDDSINPILFTNTSTELLNLLDDNGQTPLSCRDVLTVQIMQASGFNNLVMTGCPAWYDPHFHDSDDLTSFSEGMFPKSIAISDPSSINNIVSVEYLLNQVNERFEHPKICLVFHRGWTFDEYSDRRLADKQTALMEQVRRKFDNVETVDISYGSKGFEVYDNYDMHIGYRVHAHIYSLSHRIPTFLLEEDGRGAGLDKTLKFPHFFLSHGSYFEEALHLLLNRPSRENMRTIDKAIDYSYQQLSSGCPDLLRAFEIMDETFVVMQEYIMQKIRG